MFEDFSGNPPAVSTRFFSYSLHAWTFRFNKLPWNQLVLEMLWDFFGGRFLTSQQEILTKIFTAKAVSKPKFLLPSHVWWSRLRWLPISLDPAVINEDASHIRYVSGRDLFSEINFWPTFWKMKTKQGEMYAIKTFTVYRWWRLSTEALKFSNLKNMLQYHEVKGSKNWWLDKLPMKSHQTKEGMNFWRRVGLLNFMIKWLAEVKIEVYFWPCSYPFLGIWFL